MLKGNPLFPILNPERYTMDESELWRLFPSDVRKVKHAASLLNVLAGDPDRLDVLLDLQRFLAQRIRARERIVLRGRKLEARLKSLLRKGRQEKAASSRVRGSLEKCSTLVARIVFASENAARAREPQIFNSALTNPFSVFFNSEHI